MKTKTLVLFTVAAALLVAAVTFASHKEEPAIIESAMAPDCEFLVTPHGTTVLNQGVSC